MLSKVRFYKKTYHSINCNLLYKNPIVGRYCVLFSGLIDDIPPMYLDLNVDGGYVKNDILCLKVAIQREG